jgi:hypothetical protein
MFGSSRLMKAAIRPTSVALIYPGTINVLAINKGGIGRSDIRPAIHAKFFKV